MATVEFINEGTSFTIQCKPEDKMEQIFSKYANKSNLDLGSIYFVSEGKILNKDLTFSETTKENSMKVIVFKTDENDINMIKSNQTKPKFIM